MLHYVHQLPFACVFQPARLTVRNWFLKLLSLKTAAFCPHAVKEKMHGDGESKPNSDVQLTGTEESIDNGVESEGTLWPASRYAVIIVDTKRFHQNNQPVNYEVSDSPFSH